MDDFNALIAPLDRTRTGDDFADAIAIAQQTNLGEPVLFITDQVPTTFDEGLTAPSGFRAVVISTSTASLEDRALIAVLTTLDAGAVFDHQEENNDLAILREKIWMLSRDRSNYEALLAFSTGLSGLTGVLIGAAQQGIPVILDGVKAFAAALLAQRIAFRTMDRCLAAQLPMDHAALEAQKRLRLPVILGASVPRNAAKIAHKHLEATLSLTD